MKKIIIYNDDICQYIDNNKEAIAEQMQININDVIFNDASCKAANDLIESDYFELLDILKNFDKKIEYSSIYVDADLGLWYGHKHGSKHFVNLLTAVTFCCEDVNMIYFDKSNTTIKLQACHHDGSNIFKFYKVVNGRKYAIKYNDLMEFYYE